MAIEWTDPPPRISRRREDWEAIADELRARPGMWALVSRGASPATATSIKNGVMPAFRPGGAFETRTANRDNKTNRCDIYARFVGDE